MKRGISLIAVLMFMLAATTASIVVFRSLGSENFISGARLKNNESYQASQAGLESVRAWLSNKGAEVGTVVTIFIEKYKSNNPMLLAGENLDDDLRLLGDISTISTKEQKFTVYLTDVEVGSKGKPYKLKFLSIGEARDGSKHSQVGIFEVEGLYKAEFKKTPPPGGGKVPPYFGGIGSGTQGIMSSGYVTGDLKTTSGFGTYGDLIVTGSYTMSSGAQIGCPIKDSTLSSPSRYSASSDTYPINYDSLSKIPEYFGNAYVKENLTTQQAGYCGSLYVGGDMDVAGQVKIWGDLYVEGNLILNQELVVYGNVTINGNVTLSAGGQNSKFHKNLVLPKENSTYMCDNNYKITVNGTTCKVGENVPCVSNIPNTNCNGITGGVTLNYLGDQITTDKVDINGNKCTSGADCMYRIPDPLVLGSATEWKAATIPATCIELKTFATNGVIDLSSNTNVSNFMKAVNTCHDDGAVGNWKGTDETEWLVIRVKFSGTPNNFEDQMFIGNIIIVVEGKPNAIIRLPYTTKETNVLMYLTEGANTIEMKKPDIGKHRNYFIYSEMDIDKIDGSQYLEGNLFMANGTKVNAMQDPKIQANDRLSEALSSAGVIVSNEDKCKGTGLADSEGKCKDTEYDGATGGISADHKDEYHISLTNHLKVNLQSQHINKEEIDLTEEKYPEPGILVMPRMIYVGPGTTLNELPNYYSVIYSLISNPPEPLNEAKPVCKDVSSGIFSDAGDYDCSLKTSRCSGDFCTNKFFVRVR